MKEVAPYVLTGALAVQDDLEDEQLDRVSRHLGGIATVYAKHDKIAHTVALRISGTLVRDDVRYIEQRVERFAEENARVAAILISEWNGVTSELVVGMNWDAQWTCQEFRVLRSVKRSQLMAAVNRSPNRMAN
ncbi:hypothetical protein [Burkholderia cenocepacia]|uniref:hypothetical protein n=1 Tax=Burkholderia cenocepacia TaxID=95486 RepID=UPI0021197A6C|nr:hypothetical protein [Burkholderia cenocepacia]